MKSKLDTDIKKYRSIIMRENETMQKRKVTPSFELDRTFKKLKLESEESDDQITINNIVDDRRCLQKVHQGTQTECIIYTESDVKKMLLRLQSKDGVHSSDNFGQNSALNQVYSR